MSDATLPKEDTPAYERLEFPSFDRPGFGKQSGSSSSSRQQPGKQTEIVLPTATQLEEIQNQAREEGYQTAYAEGSLRMATLLTNMEAAMQQADKYIAQNLLDLALAVAQKMVQQTLKTNPDILLNTIREAIASLPHFNQGAHLVLHPNDALIVRNSMGEQLSHSGWKIFEDVQVSPGGARIETAHSQIDATLENRWQRIVATIGQDSSWIAE